MKKLLVGSRNPFWWNTIKSEMSFFSTIWFYKQNLFKEYWIKCYKEIIQNYEKKKN
jgi:hypothetical protein